VDRRGNMSRVWYGGERMSVGWKCKCGHINIREGARVGTSMLMDVCDKKCDSFNCMVPFEEVSE